MEEARRPITIAERVLWSRKINEMIEAMDKAAVLYADAETEAIMDGDAETAEYIENETNLLFDAWDAFCKIGRFHFSTLSSAQLSCLYDAWRSAQANKILIL